MSAGIVGFVLGVFLGGVNAVWIAWHFWLTRDTWDGRTRVFSEPAPQDVDWDASLGDYFDAEVSRTLRVLFPS